MLPDGRMGRLLKIHSWMLDKLNRDWDEHTVVVPVPYHGRLHQAVASHCASDAFFTVISNDQGPRDATTISSFCAL